jgi:hypothetical protein
MTNLDQFESEFRAAARTPFQYQPVEIALALLVTDLPAQNEELSTAVRDFLTVGREGPAPELQIALSEESNALGNLLKLIDQRQPDLVVTYRNLHSDAWSWPHSLGEIVDVLTQVTDVPVLLIPNPQEDADYAVRMRNTDSVMAITDHLTGDHHLVNYAVALTQPGGTLTLTHIEDSQTLERMLDAISKIPEIDTETAREELTKQLLKDPAEYIASCQQVLQQAQVDVHVERSVTLGHQLKEHVQLVEQHQTDLLVINTKDDDQLAMHGLAYPLAVQLRHTPLLML